MERRAYMDRPLDALAREQGWAPDCGAGRERRPRKQGDGMCAPVQSSSRDQLGGMTGCEMLEVCFGPRTLRRRLRPAETLYRAGDPLKSFYAIRGGCFKTLIADAEGNEQVGGFFMAGDVLGMDGLATGRYGSGAIALVESEVDIVHWTSLERGAREHPGLQRRLFAMVAGDTLRANGTLMLLGSLRARERLAAFLLNLSHRLIGNGEPATDLRLPMSRDEIGSYLGLQIETVSRLFSAFRRQGLIDVQKKDIRIRDFRGLQNVLHARCSRHN